MRCAMYACSRMGALWGQDPLRAGKMGSGLARGLKPIPSIQQHLLSTYSVTHGVSFMGGRVLKRWAFDPGEQTDTGRQGAALEVQAGLLGAKGENQLLGQEGLSCQWPRVAWF